MVNLKFRPLFLSEEYLVQSGSVAGAAGSEFTGALDIYPVPHCSSKGTCIHSPFSVVAD